MRQTAHYRFGQHSGDGFLSKPLQPSIQAPKINEVHQDRPYPTYEHQELDPSGPAGTIIAHCTGFRHATVTISYTGDSDMCIRAAAAITEMSEYGTGSFDFAQPRGLNNKWDYVNMVNTNDQLDYDEGGLKLEPGLPGSVKLEINTDGIDWLGLEIFNYAAGIIDAQVTLYND